MVFPETENPEDSDGDGFISAQSDNSLPFSIISKGMLDRIGIGSTYTTCQQDPVRDSRKVQHLPIGKVTLRWHKNEAAKSYSEPFYVVDSQSLLVILGETAFSNIDQSSGDFFGPTGVQPQTAGKSNSGLHVLRPLLTHQVANQR